jgi:hypothetical protein
MSNKKPVVKLSGHDSNAFAILATVSDALLSAGMVAESEAFLTEAVKGDYDHLIQTACQYVKVR